ncbi:MAG: hypothetical protein B7Z37_04700 [Verrucomicrobia bacterium 12-59-8]|nr:MAG: hypothetical protein B7Z37_04700 [Verrucomicrobia bacterium 12-59-8]
MVTGIERPAPLISAIVLMPMRFANAPAHMKSVILAVTVATGTTVNFIGSSYTGGTTVSGGFINAANVTAFGVTGGITLDGGGVQYGPNISIASLDLSSRAITFGVGGASFDTNGNSAILANDIGNAGDGGLTKYGYGTLFLQGSNTYAGATIINGGALNISNGNALGVGSAGVTVNVGALVLQGGNNFGTQSLTLNGSGFSAGQSGALVNAGGSNVYDGLITLGSSATITVDSGDLSLTNSGVLGGLGTLTLTGAGSGILGASIGISGGVNVTGSGSWLLAGDSSTYTGGTLVGAGSTLIFLGGALGSTSGTTLAGGTLQMYDGSGSQNIGNLGLSAGVNTIIVGAGDAMSFGSTISRTAGSTVLFNTSSGGTISTSAAGTGANKVLGYALVTNGTTLGLASINGLGNLVALTSGYTTLANNSNNGTLDFTTNGMLSNALAWNNGVTDVSADSLTFDTTGASANQSVALNGILSLSSGALVVGAANANTSLLSGGQVGATNSEVIVHQFAASGNAAAFTISSLLSGGTGSYLQDGTGTVILAGANSYTGATTINGGTLKAGVASQVTFGTFSNNTFQGFLQSSGAFGLGSAVSIASGATLDLNGFNTTIGALSGSGNLMLTNGATLTVGGYNQAGNISGAQLHTTFSGLISGTGNLVLTGSGTLALTNASNSFSGSVNINSGTLEISSMGQLGTGTGQISVNGSASTVGLPGGTLAVQGGSSGLTFNRNLTIAGRGPNTVGAALLSIGANTFSGTFTAGVVATGEARVAFEGGNNTLSGSVFIAPVAAGNNLTIYGDTNVTISGLLTGGVSGQTGFIKSGSALANSVTLSNPNNNYLGNFRLDSGTLRVFNGGALGVGTDANTIRFNNGTLEVRTEAPTSFSTRNVSLPDNNGTIFVDRGIGGTGLGTQQISSAGVLSFASSSGNVTFQNLAMTAAAARTLTLSGRNGYGASFSALNGSTGNVTVGNEVFTNSSNGLLIINSSVSLGDGTSRTLTINGNSDTILNGFFISAGAGDHFLTKSGQGYLLMNGTNTTAVSNSSFSGGTNITGGTLAVTNIKTLLNQNTTATTGSNNALNLNAGALSYLGANTTGAGETTPLVINLTGTTGVGIILANQTGTSPSALIFQNAIGAGGAGAKTLFLGGSTASSIINQIQGVIQNNSGTNTTSLAKVGSDTWLYAPAAGSYTSASSGVTVTGLGAANTNTIQVSSAAGLAIGQVVTAGGTNVPTGGVITNINGTTITLSSNIATAIAAGATITFGASTNFTGSVTVGGGTLQVQPTATSGTSGGNLFTTAQTLIFNTDALTLNGYAGGTFELMNPSATLTANLTQTMGLLQLSAGAGRVQVDAGNSTFSNILSFNGYTTRTAGAVANFAPAATLAGIQFATLPTAISSGVLSGVYFTNPTTGAIDFAGTAAINTNIAALGSPTGALLATGSVGTGNYSVSGGGTFSTTGANVANTIRISGGSSLSLGANLTITSTSATVMGGILQDNAGGASTISSTGAFTIAPVTANQELFIITGGTGTIAATPLLTTKTLTISSVLAAGTGPVTKAGDGTLVLSGQNTFTGALTIDEGVLRASGTNTQTLGAPAAATVDALRQNAYLDVNGAGATTAPYTNGTSLRTLIAAPINGAGFITSTASGTQAIQLGTSASTGSAVFSGIISDGSGTMSVIRNGASGSQALSGLNTYTGATILSGGATLQVTSLANGGTASSIGQSSNSAANLVFNGGTLQYTGATATIYQVTQTPSVSIDRLFTLASNGTIDSSGTYGNQQVGTGTQNNAALIFNNTGAVVFANNGAKTLTLTGTSVGDNEIDLLLQNNTDLTTLSLTKAGGSLWILGNTNTYSGATTITQGMLRAQDGINLPSTSNLVFNSATSANNNDGVLEMTGTFSRAIGASAGQVQWNPNLSGGFAASTAALVVNFGGAGAQVRFGAGGIGNGTGTLILNSITAQSDVTIFNPIDLSGGVRTVEVQDNSSSNYDFATLAGVISGSAGSGLTKTGGGTLYITGANSYMGNTNLTNGSTFVSSIGG